MTFGDLTFKAFIYFCVTNAYTFKSMPKPGVDTGSLPPSLPTFYLFIYFLRSLTKHKLTDLARLVKQS